MTDFIGLYRGRTVSEAELVAVCSDQKVVRKFFDELVGQDQDECARDAPQGSDRLELLRDRE